MVATGCLARRPHFNAESQKGGGKMKQKMIEGISLMLGVAVIVFVVGTILYYSWQWHPIKLRRDINALSYRVSVLEAKP